MSKEDDEAIRIINLLPKDKREKVIKYIERMTWRY